MSLLVSDADRFLSWDEAIYLAEADPQRPNIDWSFQRARGVPYLLAPVAALSSDVTVIRVYLATVMAIALVLGYSVWLDRLGWRAVAAAAVFAGTWASLVQATELLPNLGAALAGVGLAGAVLRLAESSPTPRVHYAAAVTSGAAMSLLRPTETLPLAAVLVLGAIWSARITNAAGWCRRALRALLALGTGLLIGWGSWLYEAYNRFDGPRARVAALRSEGLLQPPGPPLEVLGQYLSLADGPTAPYLVTIGLAGLAWLGLITACCAAACARADSRRYSIAVLSGSAALMAPYLFNGWMHVRFLLPAWALAALAVGVGAGHLGSRLLERGRRPRLLRVALAIGLLTLTSWHARLGDRLEDEYAAVAASDRRAALALRDMADGRPCAFYTDAGAPQIQFLSGCEGVFFVQLPLEAPYTLRPQVARGDLVFAVLRSPPPANSIWSEWREAPVPPEVAKDWLFYSRPGP